MKNKKIIIKKYLDQKTLHFFVLNNSGTIWRICKHQQVQEWENPPSGARFRCLKSIFFLLHSFFMVWSFTGYKVFKEDVLKRTLVSESPDNKPTHPIEEKLPKCWEMFVSLQQHAETSAELHSFPLSDQRFACTKTAPTCWLISDLPPMRSTTSRLFFTKRFQVVNVKH